MLDKAIEHNKEFRKPYRGAKAVDCSCRNNGDCPHCYSNRMYKNIEEIEKINLDLKIILMIWKAIKMKKYIHYGSDKFDKDKFKNIENIQFFNKPNGGLWACEVGTKFGWKEFCELEKIDWVNLSDSFKFELTPEARVLRLHTSDNYI